MNCECKDWDDTLAFEEQKICSNVAIKEYSFAMPGFKGAKLLLCKEHSKLFGVCAGSIRDI
jgi:hypothetical protein